MFRSLYSCLAFSTRSASQGHIGAHWKNDVFPGPRMQGRGANRNGKDGTGENGLCYVLASFGMNLSVAENEMHMMPYEAA